ncbi:MAG: hypothetical protein QW434_10250 [Pyrobaculum sp.]
MSLLKIAVIVVIIMLSALVAILMLWPSPGGANPQPAPNASIPDEE